MPKPPIIDHRSTSWRGFDVTENYERGCWILHFSKKEPERYIYSSKVEVTDPLLAPVQAVSDNWGLNA